MSVVGMLKFYLQKLLKFNRVVNIHFDDQCYLYKDMTLLVLEEARCVHAVAVANMAQVFFKCVFFLLFFAYV